MKTREIADGFEISRLIKGGWQLSAGHGTRKSNHPIDDMRQFVEAGYTTFDCADIYTGVEELIGDFRRSHKDQPEMLRSMKVLTKYVPDYNELATLTRQSVEKIIDRSLQRLGMERLDMVQFAWWNYSISGWVETAGWLKELQQAGKINLLSVTNFNTSRTKEIISSGIPLVTSQVQYSLLDRRPEKALTALCQTHDLALLCYGVLAGGFIGEKWLSQPDPQSDLENRSLIKYRLMIDEFGGWEAFQSLLETLKSIADKYEVGIGNVATRYILDQPAVAGVIIGARNVDHVQSNLKTFDFELDNEDREQIGNHLADGNIPEGDVFDLERDKEGKHGRIMKYNLNQAT